MTQYLHAKVTASAGHEKLRQISKDHFEISVREEAKHNMANSRVLELLAEHFKVSRNKVRIVSGHHSPSKLIAIEVES